MNRKWKNKDGTIKIHQIRTPKSYDSTIEELEKYMEFLEIPRDKWRMSHDTEGRVGLEFMDARGVYYTMMSEKQTRPKSNRPSIKDNARAIFHLIQERVLGMRKGVETVESLFGGFVNWRLTPVLPERMERELRQRGIEIKMLPPPKEERVFE